MQERGGEESRVAVTAFLPFLERVTSNGRARSNGGLLIVIYFVLLHRGRTTNFMVDTCLFIFLLIYLIVTK